MAIEEGGGVKAVATALIVDAAVVEVVGAVEVVAIMVVEAIVVIVGVEAIVVAVVIEGVEAIEGVVVNTSQDADAAALGIARTVRQRTAQAPTLDRRRRVSRGACCLNITRRPHRQLILLIHLPTPRA